MTDVNPATLVEESKLVRRYITDSISNSHSALKSCWLIMFTAGMFIALNTLNSILRFQGILDGPPLLPRSYTEPLVTYILCSMIFFLTFLRFYLGGVRIFDHRYWEVFKIVNEEIETLQHSDGLNRFKDLLVFNDKTVFRLEVFWLIFQTGLVVFLAYQIDEPFDFLIIYLTLLIVNVIWLIIVNRLTPTITRTLQSIFPDLRSRNGVRAPKEALLGWIWNNLLTAILLTILLKMPIAHETITIIGLLLCLMNCVLDFLTQWNFYFPQFSRFYSTCIEPPIGPTPPS